ncbi:MAG: efflux transporter outer membrane subunit [Caulobacteraceae bacterium]
MNVFRLALIAGASLAATACVVGPIYTAPIPTAVALHDGDAKLYATAEPDITWWRAFDDPVLDQLIERARTSNLDLKIAVSHVREARALFKDAQLDRFPRVTSDATYSHAVEQYPGFASTPVTIDSPDIGFDAAWEIDLFGRVTHVIESSKADRDAAAADVAAAQVSVSAEVARNYLELRGAQARIKVAQQNLKTEEETLKLTSLQVQVGQGDPVDVQTARARTEATRATIPELITTEAQANHRICVLLGQRPGELDTLLVARSTEPVAKVTPLPIGDASTFLRRRPDVAAAERRLAAETARTGVSTADLFPRLNVIGFVGLLSGDVSNIFKGSAEAWSVSPSVTWPAFDLGGARARLRAQQARGDASLDTYDKTVLQAIEDLQNALVAYSQQQSRIVSLSAQLDASQKAANLAHIRYKEGDIDFLRVLDADRNQLAAQDSLTAAETNANTDVVAIYKALGGGWA